MTTSWGGAIVALTESALMIEPSHRSLRLTALLALLCAILLGVEPCAPGDDCQTDSDGDGFCELSDVCPGADDSLDTDGDGVPDACDVCPVQVGGDGDGDGICDAVDPCPLDRPNDADYSGTCDSDDLHPLDDELRLDHLQVKGTHNSYHVEPAIPFHPSHRYTHLPLDRQTAEQGVRAFEIDLHLHADGLRVYHLVGVDQETTCTSLVDCLTDLKAFSDANRRHVPLQVWFELKDEAGGARIEEIVSLDRILRGVFGDDRILTPDDVRGNFPTLREAIETVGWPTLAEARGQIMFMVLSSSSATSDYREGAPSLEGRVMFLSGSDYQAPWAAVRKINNPADAGIPAAHAAGILVASNTCAADDSDASCYAEVDAGVANGVQMLKDDIPGPIPGRAYFLDLPYGDAVQCNEVTAPPSCVSTALENL